MKEGRLAFPGGAVAYTIAGAGSVVVLVHGLGGSRQTWRHLIEPLARRHTVVALDLPGHGASDASPGGYSPGAHASAIRDLMDALNIEQASIVGHSLGGGIAVQLAYQYPERISRLALISSAGFGPDVSAILRLTTLPGAQVVLHALGMLPAAITRRALSAIAATGLGASSDAGPLSQDLRAMSDARRRRGFLLTARAVMNLRGQALSAAPYLDRLAELPVLLIWGAEDHTIPPDHHHVLASRLPPGRAVEIASAGHYPHETHTAQVAGPLLEFLAGPRAPRRPATAPNAANALNEVAALPELVLETLGHRRPLVRRAGYREITFPSP